MRRRTASARRCEAEWRRTWSASGSSWSRVVRICSFAPSGSGRRRSRGSPSTRASTACSASFGPIARAASSALEPSGSSSAVPSGSVTFTSGQDSRRPPAGLTLQPVALRGQSWCLRTGPSISSIARTMRRSRSFSRRRSSSSSAERDDRLLLRLRADRLRPQLLPGLGELDEHAAAVVRVVETADEPAPLHVVEPVGHGAAREAEMLGQLPRLPPVRRAGVPQMPHQSPLAVAEVEPLERLAQRAVDVVLEPLDALHDPLDLEVERRELAPPHREVLVERVGLGRGVPLGHARILHSKTLDVKLSCRVSSSGVVRRKDT